MPYIVQSPEGWFRNKQRDICELAYGVPEDLWNRSKKKQNYYQARYRKDVKKLIWWLNRNLPSVEQSTLGPSEYSGYILGGPMMRVVDFDVASRERFEAYWPENKPWRIVVHSYDEWAQRIANVRLLRPPHTPAEPCLWWDTPSGFILMSADTDGNLLSLYDANWLLKQLCSDLPLAEQDAYPRGEYLPPRPSKALASDISLIIVGYGKLSERPWSGDEYIDDHQRMAARRVALGLTSAHCIREVVDDF